MQIVIDIPKRVYDYIRKYKHIANSDVLDIKNAIIDGTPLPKGHGVLKDVDAMINKLCTQEASELFGIVTCAEIMDFIDDEKPIIEADKE
jgi:hypothetical protein